MMLLGCPSLVGGSSSDQSAGDAATYSVTYDANSATGGTVPAPQTKTEGVDLILATNSGSLVRNSDTFVGWNTAADGSGTDYAAGATYTTNAALTLYARWTSLPTYSVTYSANGATGGTAPAAQTKIQDVTLTLATNSGSLARTGYDFAHWNTASDGGGTEYGVGANYTSNAPLALFAKWYPHLYSIWFHKNFDGATGDDMLPQHLYYGTSANLSACTYTKVGSTFLGWALTYDGPVAYADQANYTMGAAGVTLYAKWSNTITFDKNDSAAEGSMPKQSLGVGMTANLNSCAYTKTGWTFVGWATAPTGALVYANQASFTMGSSNVTLYARWMAPSVYALRDRGPAGGWVFYDKGSYSNGWRYLECAPLQVYRVWGSRTVLTAADQPGVGYGEQNTLYIIRDDATPDKAADFCANYSVTIFSSTTDDWFLPSIDELHLMWARLYNFQVGDFLADIYWSSTERNTEGVDAWGVAFGSGIEVSLAKNFDHQTRPIRAF